MCFASSYGCSSHASGTSTVREDQVDVEGRILRRPRRGACAVMKVEECVSVAADTSAGGDVQVDVLIVGAGPVGLFGAYYAGFRELSVALVDSLPEVGGQIAAMYPEKLIYDIAGFPSIRGRDLVASLVEQSERFSPTFLLGQEAQALQHLPDGSMIVTTNQGKVVRASAIVIAGGIGTFTPRPLPCGEEFYGRGLDYFVPELDVMRDKDVVIVGGGDSAFDWAVTLDPLARTVTLVHRRKIFRAHEATTRQVMESRTEVLVDTQVSAIVGGQPGTPDDRVHAVEVTHVPSGEVRTLKAQAVIAALGFTANLGPLLSWGLDVQDRRILVGTTMATNLPRIFAVGDIADYPGKVRLIAVGFGEIASAINNAATAIDPTAALFPGHSTEAMP